LDSKDQNPDLTRTKRIHFCSFQSIFVYWVVCRYSSRVRGTSGVSNSVDYKMWLQGFAS